MAEEEANVPYVRNTRSVPPVSHFLPTLEDYTPIMPDAVTQTIIKSSGFNADDPRFLRLVSVAAQRFLSCIVNDALQHYKVRSSNSSSKIQSIHSPHPDKSRLTLTMEDLTPALAEHGVNIRKPPYYD